MFNLFRSRRKSVKILLGVLLGLVAVMMVVTLIPGFGSGGGGDAQGQIVAKVGDEVITVREVQQRMQALMRNRQMPRELAEIYVPQMVDSMVNERAMAYEAQRLGLSVSADDLARSLHVLAPVLFQGGQFVGKEAYARLLQDQGISIQEFERNVRIQLLGSKLEDMVAAGVLVTPDEITRAYERLNEKVRLEYIAVTPDKFRAQVNVTPEDVRKEYEARKATFRIPEKRSLQMLVIDHAKLSQKIAAPEQDLRRLYSANIEQYRLPERVHVRHVLLMTANKPKEEVPKLRQKAEDVLKQLKSGADFAKVASENSDDASSKAKGGDLGWVVRGQTVKNFETAAFSLPPNQLSGVIATEYGFHILQVLEKQAARVQPMEEVRDALAAQWKSEQVADVYEKVANQARDVLVKNPLNAAQIAGQLDLEVVKADKVGAGDPIPEMGVNADFEAAVQRLPRGGVTPVMDAPSNAKKVVAVVTEVFPERQAELAEVEAQIRASLATQKLAQLVDEKARQAVEQARAAGGFLTKAAQSLGLEVKTTQDFTREGAADGIGPAASLLQAFTEPAGAVFGPVLVQDGRFVCRVVGKISADMTQLTSEQRTRISNEIRSRKAQNRVNLFQDSLIQSLSKQGKVEKFNEVISRIVENYRS
jgi:peptidyl-prolyl cis-trans isomerase D